jgi:hypothetical protein
MDNTEKRDSIQQVDLDTEWSEIAGEPISAIILKDEIYANGSEIACLRLAYHFRGYRNKIYPRQSSSTWCFVRFDDKVGLPGI